jgi:hypothetical protein
MKSFVEVFMIFWNSQKSFSWNQLGSPTSQFWLVYCEKLSPICLKLKETRCRGVAWISHWSNTLTNITSIRLNIYPSFFAIQQKQTMCPMFGRQMWYLQYCGLASFASCIVGTNNITFIINNRSPVSPRKIPIPNNARRK